MTETEKIADVVVAAVRAAIAPYEKRIAELEKRTVELEARPYGTKEFWDGLKTFAPEMRRRIADLEGRSTLPGPIGPPGEKGEKGIDGPVGKDGRDGVDGVVGPRGEKGLDGANGRDGVDGRDGQPGVPGRDGAIGPQGEKGLDGINGRDGTLEHATFVQVDSRTGRWLRADGSTLGEMKSPATIYRGIFRPGDVYEEGDAVTRGGSLWIARERTQTTPGEGASGWQLAAKCGRDGLNGKAGPQGPQGPTGSKGDPGRNYQ